MLWTRHVGLDWPDLHNRDLFEVASAGRNTAFDKGHENRVIGEDSKDMSILVFELGVSGRNVEKTWESSLASSHTWWPKLDCCSGAIRTFDLVKTPILSPSIVDCI